MQGKAGIVGRCGRHRRGQRDPTSSYQLRCEWGCFETIVEETACPGTVAYSGRTRASKLLGTILCCCRLVYFSVCIASLIIASNFTFRTLNICVCAIWYVHAGPDIGACSLPGEGGEHEF